MENSDLHKQVTSLLIQQTMHNYVSRGIEYQFTTQRSFNQRILHGIPFTPQPSCSAAEDFVDDSMEIPDYFVTMNIIHIRLLINSMTLLTNMF